MAVDRRWRIYVPPNLLENTAVGRLGKEMVHCVHHLLRDHSDRARVVGGHHFSWLVAADMEINDDFLPAERAGNSGLDPEGLGFAVGQTAEEYGSQLVELPRRSAWEANMIDCGSGAHGRARPWELDSGDDRDVATTHAIQCQVAGASVEHDSVQPGIVPRGLLRWARSFVEPAVDWRRTLASEIRRGVSTVTGMADYSYSRPSRRGSALKGVVFPSMVRRLPDVLVICDTSGSMSAAKLARVRGEVEGILRQVGLRNGGIRVLSVDTVAHGIERVSSTSGLSFVGAGGTDMRVGFAEARRLRPVPTSIVVITDGLTPWPPSNPLPAVPSVVVLVGEEGEAPPWARVVRVPAAGESRTS